MTELRDGSIHWDSHWNDRFRGSLLPRILEQLLNRSGFIKFINNTAVGIRKLVLDGQCSPKIIEVGSAVGTLSIAVGCAVAPAKVYLVEFVFAILLVASNGAAGGINDNIFSCRLSDGCSDLICNTGTIEHFSDPVPIVKEMMRITKWEGALCTWCRQRVSSPAPQYRFVAWSSATPVFGLISGFIYPRLNSSRYFNQLALLIFM